MRNVPVNFLRSFDPKNFSTTRASWCFWSSKAAQIEAGINTPEDMLQHVHEIRTFDNNLLPSVEVNTPDLQGCGYHKAVVLTVAGE